MFVLYKHTYSKAKWYDSRKAFPISFKAMNFAIFVGTKKIEPIS